MDEANMWLDQALAAKENTATLWLKARILNKQGQKEEAVRTADKATAAAAPDQLDFVSEIKRLSEDWRK